MTYRQLQEAVALFGLGDRATLKEIRERHRVLVRRFHPDAGRQTDPEAIRRVNAAYRVLRDYCDHYRYGFGQQEFLEQHPEERLREQFDPATSWQS